MKMDDLSLQTGDINEKLRWEEERLELLKDSLGRSDQLTENMLGILTSFESRLRKLEDTINPVYLETGNLQRRHENIEKTLACLDHVIGYYHVAKEVDPVIREGPSSGLQNYLKCMEKLQKAVKYFTSNNPGSPEMSQVTTIYEAGKDTLEREFRNLLTRHSKPVPAVTILDILAVDEELPSEETPTLEHLPPHILRELSEIANWLLNCGEQTDYMQVYSTIRAATLVKSLQCLHDHLKSGSKDSATTSLSHSPALSQKLKSGKETPSRKALKRMAFVRKASTTLMKHSLAHLEAAGLKRGGAGPTDKAEEGNEIDIDFYITGVSALLKLIQSESTLMNGIIPEKHHRKVFEMIITQALDNIVREGEQIATNIRRAVARHDHQAVLAIFPVLKHLRAVKPDFDVTLEGCGSPTRAKFVTLISTLDSAGAKALEEFVDSIRNDPDKSSHMPKDGTVHQLASNTMIFLEQLLEFSDTAGAMLMTQDPTALSTVQSPNKPKIKLAEFITKVLSALGLNLTNKAETYGDITLRAIFMLNNYNYILKSLRRTGLLQFIRVWKPEIPEYYDEQIRSQKRYYSQSWSRVLHYIMDTATGSVPVLASSPDGSKLKDKDRQNIKEKFTGFNKELEEISRTQKGYAIPDADLRETLKRDNRDFILPKYQAFYVKYSTMNFTKNPEKYIKFQPEQVVETINTFFDAAA